MCIIDKLAKKNLGQHSKKAACILIHLRRFKQKNCIFASFCKQQVEIGSYQKKACNNQASLEKTCEFLRKNSIFSLMQIGKCRLTQHRK